MSLQDKWEWARQQGDLLCLQIIRDYRECCKESGPPTGATKIGFGVIGTVPNFGWSGKSAPPDPGLTGW